jgi:hypothetical protein
MPFAHGLRMACMPCCLGAATLSCKGLSLASGYVLYWSSSTSRVSCFTASHGLPRSSPRKLRVQRLGPTCAVSRSLSALFVR